jgi:hypothetical protein
VLSDLRKVAVVRDHQLVAEHSVLIDPAYVHITQASNAEDARLAAHGVHADLLLDRRQHRRGPRFD